jgi:hypothetical protein
MADRAAAFAAEILEGPDRIYCYPRQLKVCATFASEADAAKLQPGLQEVLAHWKLMVTGYASCPPAFADQTVVVTVGGEGDPLEGPLPRGGLSGNQTSDFESCVPPTGFPNRQ